MLQEQNKTWSQPTSVIITDAAICETHGWTAGNAYAVINRPIEQPDANGYDIWIESNARHRAVKLSSSEYQVIGEPNIAVAALPIRSLRRIRIDLNTPAEMAVRDAILAVERLGADELLTKAVQRLSEAMDYLGDYVDKQIY